MKNGVITGMLDTGATFSFIPANGRIIRNEKLHLQTTNVRCQAADNTIFTAAYGTTFEITTCNEGEQVKITVRALVIEGREDLLGYDMILGNPEIKTLRLVISSEKGLLVAKRNGSEIAREENFESSAVVTTKTLTDPNSVQTIVDRYSEVFAESINTHMECEPMTISLVEDYCPPRPRMKCHNPDEIYVIRKHIDKLLSSGVIEESKSSFACNIRIVPKKSGDTRMVVNYIPINRYTISDAYPIPRIEDLFLCLKDAEYFTAMDGTEGFYQIPLHINHRYKTAFQTPVGLFQFTRCPFGLKNSPAVFQRVMNSIFKEGLYRWCLVYIDDILVFGRTIEQHNKRLTWVLEQCKIYNLKIKMSKSRFLRSEIEFLGHMIGKNTIAPIKGKTDPIYATKPSCKTDLQVILGTLNYYSRYIQDYATLTAQIRDSCKEGSPFVWSDKHQEVLDQLRRSLESAIPQVIPSTEQPKIVEIVVKQKAIEVACLTEERSLICRAGHVLTSAENNYLKPEKVMLATVLAFKKFGAYLPRQATTFLTDCKEINKILNFSELPA